MFGRPWTRSEAGSFGNGVDGVALGNGSHHQEAFIPIRSSQETGDKVGCHPGRSVDSFLSDEVDAIKNTLRRMTLSSFCRVINHQILTLGRPSWCRKARLFLSASLHGVTLLRATGAPKLACLTIRMQTACDPAGRYDSSDDCRCRCRGHYN